MILKMTRIINVLTSYFIHFLIFCSLIEAQTDTNFTSAISVTETFQPDDFNSEEFVEINITKCASFSDDDKFPWWQVDLEDVYYVYKIRLTDFAEDLNDSVFGINIQFRVGFKDITKASNIQDVLYMNKLCKSTGYLLTRAHVVFCGEQLFGRYVSIYVTNDEGKIPKKIFLCGVEVWGKDLEKKAEKRHIYNAKESSTIVANDAMLAVDGDYSIEYEKITQELQCLQFNSNTKENNSFWEIDLRKQYVVEKVIIYTLDADKNIYDEFRIQVVVHNISCFKDYTIPEELFNISCVKNQVSVKQKIEFECYKSLQGQFVSIHLYPKCRNNDRCNEKPMSLNMCEIEIWGYEVTDLFIDVAEFKPTNQSSVVHGGESHLAVDGIYSYSFYYRGKTTCTHSAGYDGQDPHPWWRVDLLRNHYITRMNIHNRGETLHSRLHNIVIRIGDKDILSIYNMNVIFEDNMICKSFVDQYLFSGSNEFDCEIPLIGQFVSIQIVDHCDFLGCHSRTHNFLTLCEVDVYGFPIKSKSIENVAVNKLLIHSQSVEEIINEENNDNRFSLSINSNIVDIPGIKEMERALVSPWWKIDLEELHVVKSVILWFQRMDKKIPSQAIAIRVGSKDIKEFTKGKYFTENLVCARQVLNVRQSGKKTFQCGQLIAGRHISIQMIEMCNDIYCTVTILPIKEIEVLGYILEKYQNVTNLAVGKNTKNTYNNEFTTLTNDGKIATELYIPRTTPQCSKITDVFPWWRANLITTVLINSITIYNVKGNQSKLMHDVEIRVGNVDIANSGKQLFTQNDLCLGLYNQSIPEGANTFNCSSPTFGRYLSIQIVKSCNAETCGSGNHNVLFLCEVEVTGKSIQPSSNIQGKLLSQNKTVVQSSYSYH